MAKLHLRSLLNSSSSGIGVWIFLPKWWPGLNPAQDPRVGFFPCSTSRGPSPEVPPVPWCASAHRAVLTPGYFNISQTSYERGNCCWLFAVQFGFIVLEILAEINEEIFMKMCYKIIFNNSSTSTLRPLSKPLCLFVGMTYKLLRIFDVGYLEGSLVCILILPSFCAMSSWDWKKGGRGFVFVF